jgi:hypothetical protein
MYDYITKLCLQQVEVIQNHEDELVHSIEQGKVIRRKYKRFKFDSGQAYNLSID